MNQEIFKPSLSATDRAENYTRPWNPWHLVFVAFFGGLAAAAILQTLNWRRLNRPGAVVPTGVILGVLTVALGLGLGYVSGLPEDQLPFDGQVIRLIRRAAAVIIAVVVATLQSRQYEIAERMDAEKESVLWIPAISAVVASFLIQVVLALIGARLSF